ncbi:D-alanyl-D-alanine carboxypeptidase family protein [Massilia sp. ST3]|uniref:D-alanyl-D-alanine carboxypeptidase family protein n=1 Tax=Massilia sp. ST3 TaxID=2824903 RepID=UPI001B80F2F8|nr:M15 family metallopeptidase [Massilia sp. ST3]MBQ5949552.1 M15 family metallopeptidase [Massilia sp. ST3]
MDIKRAIEAVQAKLGVEVDGRAGPETWKAIYTAIVGDGGLAAGLIDNASATVDQRSEKIIAQLHPRIHPYARALVKQAGAVGIQIKLISGLRTYAEQDKLFAQGRTDFSKGKKKVTNARGGESNHNFGLAFDIGVFDNETYLQTSPKYKAVGAIGLELGLEWGGNWKSIVDQPHFQLRPDWAKGLSEKAMLAQLRERHSEQQDYFA